MLSLTDPSLQSLPFPLKCVPIVALFGPRQDTYLGLEQSNFRGTFFKIKARQGPLALRNSYCLYS